MNAKPSGRRGASGVEVVFDLLLRVFGSPAWSPEKQAAFMAAAVYPAIPKDRWTFEERPVGEQARYLASVSDDERRAIEGLPLKYEFSPQSMKGVTIRRA
jgi:hypothetical protein